MSAFDKEMMDALRADAEKLLQLTGKDHGPWVMCGICGARLPDPPPFRCSECGCATGQKGDV